MCVWITAITNHYYTNQQVTNRVSADVFALKQLAILRDSFCVFMDGESLGSIDVCDGND